MSVKFPFVSRKRYQRLVAERDAARTAIAEQRLQIAELQDMHRAVLELPRNLANRSPVQWLKCPAATPTGESCLFVTHAATQQLKPHVLDHCRALIDAGIGVILVINTDLPAEALQVPQSLLDSLHGCVRRENAGYDFAAWAHAYSLLDTTRLERLYLVNDSIVGPLDDATFGSMIARIRASHADLVGLTQNPHPRWHLQSFFLIANRGLLRAPLFRELMLNIVNLPTKQAVIDTYETQISGYLLAHGLRCAAVFPQLEPGSPLPDDSFFRWSQLVDSGFPYVKASILKRVHGDAEARTRVPARYRDAAAVS